MPLCTWVVNFMPLLEQSCIIKIHARSTLKGKMIVTSQLICFPHSQVARLVLLQALKPNLHLNLSVLFDLAKKTKIIHVIKCVTSHPWLYNQVHLKEEKMNRARLRECLSIVHSPILGKRLVSCTFVSAVQGSISPYLTMSWWLLPWKTGDECSMLRDKKKPEVLQSSWGPHCQTCQGADYGEGLKERVGCWLNSNISGK